MACTDVNWYASRYVGLHCCQDLHRSSITGSLRWDCTVFVLITGSMIWFHNLAGMCSCFLYRTVYAKICWSPFALLSIIGIFKLSNYLDICMLSYVSHSRLKDNTTKFFCTLQKTDQQVPGIMSGRFEISLITKILYSTDQTKRFQELCVHFEIFLVTRTLYNRPNQQVTRIVSGCFEISLVTVELYLIDQTNRFQGLRVAALKYLFVTRTLYNTFCMEGGRGGWLDQVGFFSCLVFVKGCEAIYQRIC